MPRFRSPTTSHLHANDHQACTCLLDQPVRGTLLLSSGGLPSEPPHLQQPLFSGASRPCATRTREWYPRPTALHRAPAARLPPLRASPIDGMGQCQIEVSHHDVGGDTSASLPTDPGQHILQRPTPPAEDPCVCARCTVMATRIKCRPHRWVRTFRQTETTQEDHTNWARGQNEATFFSFPFFPGAQNFFLPQVHHDFQTKPSCKKNIFQPVSGEGGGTPLGPLFLFSFVLLFFVFFLAVYFFFFFFLFFFFFKKKMFVFFFLSFSHLFFVCSNEFVLFQFPHDFQTQLLCKKSIFWSRGVPL